ncbi:19508_t:CDS:1, partial [Gigaspora margarita]
MAMVTIKSYYTKKDDYLDGGLPCFCFPGQDEDYSKDTLTELYINCLEIDGKAPL